jgi:hypothetical protein
LDEEIQDDAFLTALLEELSEESDSSSLTWKREGLRILDCTEDGEEEIDAGTFPIEKNMESLLRKRRLEMAEDDELTTDLLDNTIRVAQGWLSGTARAPAATKLNMIVAEGRKSREQDQSLMFSGLFSASTALDKYMEMHGKAPKKVKTAESQPDLIPPSVKVTAPEVPYPTDKSTVDPKPIRKTSSLPPLPGRLPPCSFIISATLLTQRHLIRTLQQVYPEIEMIERDFDAPHSPAKEADIILSPSTGLILTTLQKIKQRALPGQPDHSSIKARILVLSNRYEQLVVYVSEGLSVEREKEGLEHPLNELDEYDNKALAELKHFSSSMEAVVSIKYVPGGDEALASWIVWAMNHWGISTIPDRPPKMELLQEETMVSLNLLLPAPIHQVRPHTNCAWLPFSVGAISPPKRRECVRSPSYPRLSQTAFEHRYGVDIGVQFWRASSLWSSSFHSPCGRRASRAIPGASRRQSHLESSQRVA